MSIFNEEVFILILIFILTLSILVLSIALVIVIKKATYLSKKKKDIIIFTIDMYLDYGEQIDIIDKEKHPIIIEELEKVKLKLK